VKPVWPILGVIGLSAAFAVTQKRMYAAPVAEVERRSAPPSTQADTEAVPESPSAPAADSADEPSGEVLESQDVAGYTYLRLKTSAGEVWAAVPRASVKLHDKVRITGANLMLDFERRTLKRTFPKIYFGSLAGADAAAGKRAPSTGNADALPPGHPNVGPGPVSGDEALPPGHPPIDAAPLNPYADGNPLPPGHPPIDAPSL
jgi:hypothetical protein